MSTLAAAAETSEGSPLVPSELQERMLDELRENFETNTGSEKGLVLRYHYGSGRTVACCLFLIGRCSTTLPADKLNVRKDEEPKKIVAKRDILFSVADEINKLLCSSKSITQETLGISRTVWQTTKRSWLTLTPGKTVAYSSPVVAAYSVGTTLLHAVFFMHLLLTFENLVTCQAPKRALILCGGSGAELISLKLLLKRMKGDVAPFELITCVDINDWDGMCDTIWGNTSSEIRSKTRFKFHKLDILATENREKISALIREADFVSMVYGLTEIHDRDPAGALYCLQTIFRNLKQNAEFLIIDPLKTCFAKDIWVDSVASQFEGVSINNDKVPERLKLSMTESDVCDSVAFKWIDSMKLRLNEDVKLSMHVWCKHYVSNINSNSVHASSENKSLSCLRSQGHSFNLDVSLFIVNSMARVSYVKSWLNKLNNGCNMHVHDFCGLQGSESKQEINSGLFHVYSSILNASGAHQVIVLTNKQLALVERSKDLQSLFQKATVAVLDDFEFYLHLNSPKKVKRAINSLQSTLPEPSRRVIICPDYQCKITEYAMDICNMKRNPSDKVSSSFTNRPDDISMLNDIYIQHCCAKSISDCTGILNRPGAIFINFDNRRKEFGSDYRVIFPKDLEHMPESTSIETLDIVFQGQMLNKISKHRLDQLKCKAIGKLAGLNKTTSSPRTGNRNAHKDKRLKTEHLKVCLHVHYFDLDVK